MAHKRWLIKKEEETKDVSNYIPEQTIDKSDHSKEQSIDQVNGSHEQIDEQPIDTVKHDQVYVMIVLMSMKKK